MLSGPSFRSAFVFIINSLILSGFLLISFHLAKASISGFSWLYTLVCVIVQKYQTSFIYNCSHFWYPFCNQPVLFAQLDNVNKLWNNNRAVHVNERNQNKNKTKTSLRPITSHFCLTIPLPPPHPLQSGCHVWDQSLLQQLDYCSAFWKTLY